MAQGCRSGPDAAVSGNQMHRVPGILAGMTTCALSADVLAAAPFNANFFIVAATVIPVLFLAIAVQGRTYESLLKAFSDANRVWLTPGPWIRAPPPGFSR